jgi:DNA repair exonuclease SbcCD ATPase subunit
MAQGGKEHRMVFDIRGRRKYAVKVVYAVLAVLMGASLFLVVGPLNIGELFNSNGSAGGEVAKPYEEQAEKLEAKLRKAPEDPDLLLGLTRARVTAGKTMVTAEPTEEAVLKALQQYQLASSAWSEYLEATKEPSAGVAQLMAPALFSLASEGSRTYPEAQGNIEAASQAQMILAEQRPTLNAYSTLALYTYFTGDYKSAEAAQAKAAKLTREKFEREQLDKQMEEVKKNAEKFQKERKRIAAAEKAAAKSNKGNPESLQSPSTTLGGTFGTGTGLGE